MISAFNRKKSMVFRVGSCSITLLDSGFNPSAKLKKAKVSVDIICESTGLTEDEIEKL